MICDNSTVETAVHVEQPKFPFALLVAGELLWFTVSGGLSGVPQGHAVSQHPPEPADLCPGGFQVP